MALTIDEIKKLEKIYGYDIKSYKEYYESFIGRFCTRIRFSNQTRPIKRNTSAWSLETILGRKLNTRRLGGDEECDHIDGNGLNDNGDNLQVLLRSDNMRKSIIQNKLMGENHYNSKLTENDIYNIFNMYYNEGVPKSHIFRKFNISGTGVGYILNNTNWKHTNFKIPDNPNIKDARGMSGNSMRKLTEQQVFKILCLYYFENYKIVELVKYFNISKGAIDSIIYNITWRNIPRQNNPIFFQQLPLIYQPQYNPNFFIKNCGDCMVFDPI